MMTLDVAFLPSELAAKSIEGSLAVLVDVVRASTTITIALAHGCSFVRPVLHVEDAFQYAQDAHDSVPLLLGGERGGRRVKGFDLGNSPREYTREVVQHKGIIFSTTNGTRTLLALNGAAQIVIGAFVNMAAVCQYLADRCASRQTSDTQSDTVLIACSGVVNTFALEDTVCAGMIVHRLSTACPDMIKTTAATSAEILYRHYQADLLSMLHISDGGQRMRHIGLEADLPVCAGIDTYPVVPKFCEGKLML
jgi:2-phosphosulfolactate phosphatase